MSLAQAGPSARRRALCSACLAQRRVTLPANLPRRPLHTTSPRSAHNLGRPTPFPDEIGTFKDSNDLRRNRGQTQIREHRPSLSAADFVPASPPGPAHIVRVILQRLPEYVRSERFRGKVAAYGLDQSLQLNCTKPWVRLVEDTFEGKERDVDASRALAVGGWDEKNLVQSFGTDGSGLITAIEATMLRRFVTFASTLEAVPPQLQNHLKALLDATDLTKLPFRYNNVQARAMRRNFHLHIGPTNSGKTYNALKSLAQAETGVYCGPLRLLAHEVWERLNLGTVGGLDGEGKKCNLITGEERRIVDPSAGLMSCTVEMIPLHGPTDGYDIVVIDEIQMMGDPQRGGSWTAAVLGVRAKQVHLCGDETTLDLLQDLLPSLGDSLTIHRYERLTPLAIADESLKGDLDNVQPGDCVVTFSRNNIFAVKKQIEHKTGRKCAVVYGALPPETRADQARDFNDEDGHSEILVASDAVGMGLNLKIKRIVFEALQKWNGRNEVPLSLTQVKQIAGRAGRFGMHKAATTEDPNADVDDPVRPDEVPEPGGIVTTLHKADLPILREVLPLKLPSITRAYLDIPYQTMSDLQVLLPQDTTFASLLDHLNNLCVLPPNTTAVAFQHKLPLSDVVEPLRDRLTLQELDMFTYAPVSTRDATAISIFTHVVRAYADSGVVRVEDVFKPSRLLNMLDVVEGTLAVLPPLPPILGIGRRLLTPPVIISSIPQLESLHKCLVLYIWLSFRLEVSFPDRAKASALKNRTEVVLDQCLARLPGVRNKKTYERGKENDRVVAQWRKANVSPNGTQKVPGTERKGIKWVEAAVVQRLKNKEVWASTGMVEPERYLKERGGKGWAKEKQIEGKRDGGPLERSNQMLIGAQGVREG